MGSQQLRYNCGRFMMTKLNPGNPSLDMSTLPPMHASDAGSPSSRSGKRDVTRLVVLWSRDEPHRIGEAIRLPPHEEGPWIFGRGEVRGDEPRLSLVRQRPGELVSAGPLLCPRISRAQLRLFAGADGIVAVENVGACALLLNDREVKSSPIIPGDVLSLRNELLLLCVRGAPMPPQPPHHAPFPVHRFGQADQFGLVGESAACWTLRQRIVAIAQSTQHVLILGDSGSGKELVARAIHGQSARSERPLIARNAATIPEGLADAELFGNLRNYPNPGMPERPGLIGQAHGTTLFLDEFGELPQGLQAHLLRLLDNGEYQRLGDATTRHSDLRFLAATNRPPSCLKHDVLARLKVRIQVPDLNSRKEDIPLLVAHLLRRHAATDPSIAGRFFPGDASKDMPLVSPVLIEALVRHTYTTHVRELDALLLRAALEGRGRYLELTPDVKQAFLTTLPPQALVENVDDFSAEERIRLLLLRRHRFSPTACGRDPEYPGNRQTADLHLRQLLCRTLQIANWDTDRTAALLAGSDDPILLDKSNERLTTFLSNLQARLITKSEQELREALAKEWKNHVAGVLLVVEALRERKITGKAGAFATAETPH